MDHFFDMEFFNTKCSILSKHLYILYSFCGAIFYENYVRLKFKRFLLVYLLIAYLCSTLPCVKALIQGCELQYIYHAFTHLCFCNFVALRIFIFYRSRIEFHRLFDLIEENSHTSVVTLEDGAIPEIYLQEANVLKLHYICLDVIYTFPLIFFVKLFAVLASMSNNNETQFEISPPSEFFIPFFCDDCNTRMSYSLAMTSTFLLIGIFGVVNFASQCSFSALSVRLKNRAVVLQNTIRFQSDLACRGLERCHQDEKQELNKNRPNVFQLRFIVRSREKLVDEYMIKVRQWIEIHQRFIRCVNQFQTCGEGIFESAVSLSSLCIVVLGYFMSNVVIEDDNLIIQYILFIVIHVIGLFVYCQMGNDVANDLSEIISEAVYATPWFFLPAKEQKVILNFLTLSQRAREIRLFKAFELDLKLLPVILKNTYDYIQIMRLLVMRGKN